MLQKEQPVCFMPSCLTIDTRPFLSEALVVGYEDGGVGVRV